VDRVKLGKVLMMLFGFPLALLMLGNCIANNIPPTESYKKAPFQFERLFNEKMAQYGMSIDLDSANYSYGEHITKTVPIQCADGSKVTCTMYTTNDRKKALIEYMVFTQELTGKDGETIYLEPILKFMLDEFYCVMTENKDEPPYSISDISYNEAVRLCSEFVNGSETSERFLVSPISNLSTSIRLERKADGMLSISISLLTLVEVTN